MFTAYIAIADVCTFYGNSWFPTGYLQEVHPDNQWSENEGNGIRFRFPSGSARIVTGCPLYPIGKITLDGRVFIMREMIMVARSSRVGAQSWLDDAIHRFKQHHYFFQKLYTSNHRPFCNEAYWHAAKRGKSPEDSLACAELAYWQGTYYPYDPEIQVRHIISDFKGDHGAMGISYDYSEMRRLNITSEEWEARLLHELLMDHPDISALYEVLKSDEKIDPILYLKLTDQGVTIPTALKAAKEAA